MRLYFLWTNRAIGYDEYDSAVIAAVSKKRALTLASEKGRDGLLPLNLELCDFIGTARRGTKEGIICASFNAG